MTFDDLKTAIAIIASLAAIISAVYAHQARVRTRHDIFEGYRDSLILAMMKNDAQAARIKLRAGFLRERLEALRTRVSESGLEQLDVQLENTRLLDLLAEAVDTRTYNRVAIEAFCYSENDLKKLRIAARNEQSAGENMSDLSTMIVIDHIADFLKSVE